MLRDKNAFQSPIKPKPGLERENTTTHEIKSVGKRKWLEKIEMIGQDKVTKALDSNLTSDKRRIKKKRSLTDRTRPGHPLGKPPSDYIEVIVELPPGSITKPRRKFMVPPNATADQIQVMLADYFRVGRDTWNLYVSKDDESPSPISGRDISIREYSMDKNRSARLYFYPEILI